jgi:hypothetical protein
MVGESVVSDPWAADIALLIGAFGWVVPGVLAFLTYRRAGQASVDIRKIEIATNSMKDALVLATATGEHAKGVIQGRADEKAAQKDNP